MTKSTHTHRGTCQACGHVQAVDNTSGLVAKHGYTVDWGYFNGTCQASDRKPAEHDVMITKSVIAFCTETAAEHDKDIAALNDGSVVPATFKRWNPTKEYVSKDRWGRETKGVGADDVLPIAKATKEERAKAIALAIHDHEMHASGLRSHAQGLTQFVLPRHDQPLFSVAELNAPKPVEAAPVVDVKAAKVTGTFKTKAARKNALDRLSVRYDKLRRELQNMYLALSDRERNLNNRTDLYYGQQQLSHWRPKHAEAWVREFPQSAAIVAEINELVAAREAVKNAP